MKLVELMQSRVPRLLTPSRLPPRPPGVPAGPRTQSSGGSISDTINGALIRAGLISEGPRATQDVAEWKQPPVHSTANRAIGVEHLGAAGAFVTRSFANAAGRLDYKLYIPKNYAERSTAAMPLVVMLHGCTQSPDDFAAGTRMNELADAHGFLVAYPAQSARANGSRCWNWFVPGHQRRDQGEPSLIAGITQEITAAYCVDSRRVFVAGLSAGGAMATILAATYPDIYAAVGVHSGLPFASAHDVPSAFQAMADARTASPLSTNAPPCGSKRSRRPVPTIVFHGDSDSTVAVANGLGVAADAIRALKDTAEIRTVVRTGRSASGRTFTQTAHVDSSNRPHVETWILHDGGHAWSGGSEAGSFTAPDGVDASAEMLRFFGAQSFSGRKSSSNW